MFAASKTAAVSGAGPDDKFNYVTMLLHGDGTNGAQNNTFLDSSTNNFTITRNGNTTQGSFSPYGSNWSVASTTAGNYLTVDSTVALGSSDYTVEFWFAGSSFEMTWGTPGGYAPIAIPNSGTLYFADSSNSSWPASVSSFIVKDGSWNHYAIVRQSGAFKVFRNGTQIATPSGPSSNATNGNVVIGYYNSGMSGFVSNFRAVVGTAVYTSTFTPPTTPLTVITNTKLLTCQSNRFIDNSTNNYTITATGTPSVQRFNPFGTSTAYSTSVIGGSGYFDKSGDYLDGPTNSAFAFGTGDFTISAWVYVLNGTSAQIIWTNQTTSSANAPNIGFFILNNKVCLNNTNTAHVESIGTIANNSWNYIGVTRASGTYTFYINGSTSGTTGTIGTDNITENACHIGYGNYGTSYYFGGYIADLRIIKGSAVAPTVPTAPVGTVTNTQLLLNMQNGAILDNAMMNDLETVGNAQISTSVKKYGTGSMYFDGTGDYLVGNGGQGLGGDFTIEAWVYALGFSGDARVIVDTRDAWFSTTGILFYFNDAGNLIMYVNGGDRITSATAYSTSTWYHVALARSGSTITMYVNGTSVGTYTYSTALTDKTVIVGTATDNRNTGTAWKFYGYIDDLRITSGFARYTSTFTPPTSALSDTGPY